MDDPRTSAYSFFLSRTRAPLELIVNSNSKRLSSVSSYDTLVSAQERSIIPNTLKVPRLSGKTNVPEINKEFEERYALKVADFELESVRMATDAHKSAIEKHEADRALAIDQAEISFKDAVNEFFNCDGPSATYAEQTIAHFTSKFSRDIAIILQKQDEMWPQNFDLNTFTPPGPVNITTPTSASFDANHVSSPFPPHPLPSGPPDDAPDGPLTQLAIYAASMADDDETLDVVPTTLTQPNNWHNLHPPPQRPLVSELLKALKIQAEKNQAIAAAAATTAAAAAAATRASQQLSAGSPTSSFSHCLGGGDSSNCRDDSSCNLEHRLQQSGLIPIYTIQ